MLKSSPSSQGHLSACVDLSLLPVAGVCFGGGVGGGGSHHAHLALEELQGHSKLWVAHCGHTAPPCVQAQSHRRC